MSCKQKTNRDMDRLGKLVDDLYYFRDRFFEFHSIEEAGQKPTLLNAKLQKTIDELDEIDDVLKNDAEYLMLRGKALNVVAQYDETAEKLLSKAVKLDPKLTDAWISLGDCYWKKNDVPSAQNCFLSSLNHKKDKVSLRNLSMITRSIGTDFEERCKNIESSFDMAKEAVQIDVSDGLSWLTLGNAYLAKYFISRQNFSLMKQSLTAYSKAEKDPASANNFDLHFNKGTVHEYLENYEQALKSYSKARCLDPTFEEATQKEKRLLQYLRKLSDLVKAKGHIKAKRLKALIEKINLKTELAAHSTNCTFEEQFSAKTLSELLPGANPKTLFVGKVVGTLIVEEPVCLTFCAVDKTGSCAVTLYNAALQWSVKIGDSVAIPEPNLRHDQFNYEGETFDFYSVRIDSPTNMLVNGRVPKSEALAPTVLTQFMKQE